MCKIWLQTDNKQKSYRRNNFTGPTYFDGSARKYAILNNQVYSDFIKVKYTSQ